MKLLVFFIVVLCIEAYAQQPGFLGGGSESLEVAKAHLNISQTGQSLVKVAEFCKVNAMLNIFDKNPTLLGSPANENSLFSIERENGILRGLRESIWETTTLPSERLRREAYNRLVIQNEIRGTKLNSYELIKNYFEKFHQLNKEDLVSAIDAGYNDRDYPSATIQQIKTYPEIQGREKTRGAAKPAKMYFCSKLPIGIMNLNACADHMDQIISLMTPRSYTGNPLSVTYTAIPLFEKVMTDEGYAEGLRIAALKLMALVESNAVPNTNFFEDISSSYIQAGVTPNEAIERTWDILGLLATSGANIHKRLFRIKISSATENLTKYALSIMSIAAPVLDSRTMGSGHPYSYPRSVSTTCDFGKPYHFWLTAYLARTLTLQSGNSEAAAAASFTSQKGYEMISQTAGRDPTVPFRIDTFHNYNNLIRMDLAFSSAGALYGAFSAGNIFPNFNIDEGLKVLVSGAKRKTPMSEADSYKAWAGTGLSGVNNWYDIFAPDNAYVYYRTHR
jgi:hypothetical protein